MCPYKSPLTSAFSTQGTTTTTTITPNFRTSTTDRLLHKVIKTHLHLYIFAQLLFSCCVMVKGSCIAKPLTARWGVLSRGAETQTLADRPGGGMRPDHYSVLQSTTTQPATVCGPIDSDQMTLDSRCVGVAMYVWSVLVWPWTEQKRQVNNSDHILHGWDKFMTLRGHILQWQHIFLCNIAQWNERWGRIHYEFRV